MSIKAKSLSRRSVRIRAEILCLVLTGLFLPFCLSSNAAPAPLTDYFQETWTTRDGLPHNTINSLQQSEDGYLWIGTWEGAARFNGREFRVFGRGELTGLPDSGIRAISRDRQHNLIMVGARGGISKRAAMGWQSLPELNVLINAVAEDSQGNLWLATEGKGLFRHAPDGERRQFAITEGVGNDVVHSILAEYDGSVWAGTGSGLVRLTNRDKTVLVTPVAGLPEAPVFALKRYGDSLLIGTERGLYRYESGRVQVFAPGISDLPVSTLLVSGKQVWIGTTDHGLLRYSERGLETLSMAKGLPNNRILSLFEDREGSIWVGTNGGLFRLRDAPFVTLTSEHGLSGDYIRTVLAHSDGSVWIGSSQGVSRLRNNKVEAIDLSAVSAGQSILSLREAPDGSVWIGTYSDGIVQWRDGRIVSQYDRRNGLLANEIRAIAFGPGGGLWVGTGQGLNYVDETGVHSFTREHGLPTPFIMALYLHHDGRLFIGTGGGVAVRYPDGQIKALDFSSLDGAKYAFGFTPDPEAGILWMATDRGLVAFDLNSAHMTMLGRKAGLPFDKVLQAIIDQGHNIWLSSNRGIMRFDRHQIDQYLAGQTTALKYELFGESDGLQSAQANGGSMQAAALDHNGSIWFATSKGASRVDPGELERFAATRLPVVIEGVKVNGKAIPRAQAGRLSAGTNRVELQFAGLGFVMPQRIQYRTQLMGFDNEWIERGTNNTAEYTSLPPGDYRFLVTAAYPQGSWNEQYASYSFSVAPHFWQRPIFWLAMLLTSAALVFVVHRWRLRSLKRSAELLSAQVAAKTLELKQQADHLRAVDRERSALLAEIKRQAHEFEQQARLDSLTGLANRRAFDEALERECALARRNQLPLCLALLDIDHFKQVNDFYTHAVGDEILKLVAHEIDRHCRQADTLARWGGEEFALLLPDSGIPDVKDISERIRAAVAGIDCSALGPNLQVTISIGAAQYIGGEPLERLLSRTDALLYKAKQNGRNRIEVAQ
ncbi:diguanylate cyclase [Alteromonas gilva]|uniref:diguanylate cyclase n=1 Tax=Alteromonas gilva TaxID=2987522 RepID=A0ABT5KYM0_9ALTE|nr:diguanylate cyclase [Alteromonas gilva]MDC8829879.1 diguanylate cyclase [Alteromonas gilva]